MGDCGAFNYVHEEEPPYTVDEVFDFYEECGFDYGISVDHIILAYLDRQQRRSRARSGRARQELTLEYAAQFFRRHRREQAALRPARRGARLEPDLVRTRRRRLQRIGYRYIALGGMVPLKTPQILRASRRSRASDARDATPPSRHHSDRTRQRLQPLRRRELRQHLAVSAVVQGRPRQLPHASSATTSRSG